MTVEEALQSDKFTEGQKCIIKWQYSKLSGFTAALYEAIARADRFNLGRLEFAFPMEVRAFVEWQQGEDYTADLVNV